MSGPLTERLHALSLFSRCGEAFDGVLPIPYKQVTSWENAQALCQQVKWKNTTLEVANALRLWLAVNRPAEWDKWNEVVEHCKPVFEATVGTQLREYVTAHHLSVKVVHCVQWDLVLTLVEDWYSLEGMPTLASNILFPVYEAGHFPCGWSGRQFPEGTLYIF